MIRHALFIRFGAGTLQPERDAVLQSFIALCDHVGEVSSLACGPDADPQVRAIGFTHAFAVVFGTTDARDAFRALPDYTIAWERLSQAAEAVQVVDDV